MRIYGIPEDSESGNTVKLIEGFLKELLKMPAETQLQPESSQISSTQTNRPKCPCKIILGENENAFSAWNETDLRYIRNQITVDYTPATQRKRKEYAEIKRQLSERKIRFQSPHPAKLRVHLDSGVKKKGHSAWEAAEGLATLGIKTNLSEWERADQEWQLIGWHTARGEWNRTTRERTVFEDAAQLMKTTTQEK